jgi:hypothetical protein
MMQRCYYPSHYGYAYYGGEGIEVCPRWRTFSNFLADMGEKPEGMSLERVNCRRNYWAGNCIWVPKAQQQANRRNCHQITWNGRTMTIAAWERELGWRPNTLRCRLIRYSWSLEKAMTTPVGRTRRDQGVDSPDLPE